MRRLAMYLIILLAGCTPIMMQPVDLSKLPPESVLALDVRPCEGPWFCYPWIAPHKLDIYRNKAGEVQVMPEASNGQGLDALTSPVESAFTHFSWGVP